MIHLLVVKREEQPAISSGTETEVTTKLYFVGNFYV